MSKERYVEHTVAWELPNRDSVTKGNYNLADIETKYIPIQTEIISDNKDKTINKLQQRIAELEQQLKNAIVPKFKIGQEVYTIRHNNSIYHTRIDEIKVVGNNGKNEIFYYYDQPGSYAHWEEVEDNLFSTKADAQAKLKELQ